MSRKDYSTGGSDAESLQPFADAAPRLAKIGLIPVPVGFDKRPAVANWQQFSPSTYRALLPRFAHYNVGILNGRGPRPLTVVDIDDTRERDWCRERFGDTPAKVRTAGGGEHWYFAYNGERRRTRIDGHTVDLLGSGGFGLLPPSHSPSGVYQWIEGDTDALADLPTIRATETTKAATDAHDASDGRNNTLFRAMLSAAANLSRYDDLMAEACEANREFAAPLDDAEVQKITASVWRYKEEGRLMTPGCESGLVLWDSLVEKCLKCPDALALLAKIKKLHGAKGGEPFALPAATGPEIMGWSRGRFLRARNHLVGIGELRLVQAGQKGKRKPTIVRFPTIRI